MPTATPLPSLVRPGTRRLAHLAQWSLRVVFLLVVIVAVASQATAAPVVFDASGEFEDGYELSGTITIDTATGDVLAADLQVEWGTETISFTDLYKISHSPAPKGSTNTSMLFVAFPLELQLTVHASTLVGYAGGPLLCDPGSDDSPSSLISLDGYATRVYSLDEGSLEP
ncbi:MAG TPA: hypothetical protein VEI07_08900 [Planctomycetaceae bacterium]|nr:hypothetical protein [Planctomycetaceae bacterium]